MSEGAATVWRGTGDGRVWRGTGDGRVWREQVWQVRAWLLDRATSADGRPTRRARLSGVLAERLAALPQHWGIEDLAAVAHPVTEQEAATTGLSAGSALPPGLVGTLNRARAAPVEELLAEGLVPSAQILAQLLRSERLTWRRPPSPALVARAARLLLEAFPETPPPGLYVAELATLADAAGMSVPLVQELQRVSYLKQFGVGYLSAAQVAGEMLGGTLYERYYGINYDDIRRAGSAGRPRGWPWAASPEPAVAAARWFNDLLLVRAGVESTEYPSVRDRRTVVEQAQILTSANLAAFVGPLGGSPCTPYAQLAERAFEAACNRLDRTGDRTGPVARRAAARAWRQLVFFLALATPEQRSAFPAWAAHRLAGRSEHVGAVLTPALHGLEHIAGGGEFDGEGRAGDGRRLLVWDHAR